MNIFDIYNTIETPEINNKFNVITISGTNHKMGKSVEGFPMFFVNSRGESNVPNINMEFLSVQYNQTCDIIENNIECNIVFTIITLKSTEETLLKYFIDIFMLVLQKFDFQPSVKKISIEIENIITIFSAMHHIALKTIQGLWAELLIIYLAKDTDIILSAWHNNPNDKYDFSLGKEKLEVKSSTSYDRIHHFSMEQLNPTQNSELVIASTTVIETGKGTTGLSIIDLADKIIEKTHSIEMKLKLKTVIANTIGCDINKTSSVYFDLTTAVDKLAFFDYRSVPSIELNNVPIAVSNVNFSSSLEGIEEIPSNKLSGSELYKFNL